MVEMNKYRNIKVEVDGLRFDSRREANYYGILKLKQKAAIVHDFSMQVKYPIEVNDVKICTYIADFVVQYEQHGKFEVVDVKGIKTPVYKLKKKLMKAIYGIDIVEV